MIASAAALASYMAKHVDNAMGGDLAEDALQAVAESLTRLVAA